MNNSNIGDRIKLYEKSETQQKFIPTLPIVIRIDGRSFSQFTKPLKRPYDEKFSRIMIEITKRLVDQTNAVVGYTQSDEISLILYSDSLKSQTFFNGRKDKILSVVSGITTSAFLYQAMKEWPEYIDELNTQNRLPAFDCRAFNVPSKMEAVNCLVWREQDATKNAIQMFAREYFSHHELHGLSGNEIQHKLITEKGVNFNDEPAFFKRGTYVIKEQVITTVDESNVDSLAKNEKARENMLKKGEIVRNEIKEIDFQQLSKIGNKIGTIFYQEKPTYN